MNNLVVKYRNKDIKLDDFTFDKTMSRLTMVGKMGLDSVHVEVKVPYKISKVKDDLFDVSKDISQLLLFRNRSFGENNLIRLNANTEQGKKPIGYVFSLNGILNSETLMEEHKAVIPYAIIALVTMLHGKDELPSKQPIFGTSPEFKILDFFDSDLVVCVISKEQLVEYNSQWESSLLYRLSAYGFYLIKDSNFDFIPERNEMHKSAYQQLVGETGTGVLSISLLDQKVLSEPFFQLYITSLINRSTNPIAKFILCYQCFEILIDFVLKNELTQRISGIAEGDEEAENKAEELNGFKIKELVSKLGKESHRIVLLFNHYCKFDFESDYHSSFKIHEFFSKYWSEYDGRDQSKASHFYEFRNQIVHNYKVFCSAEDGEGRETQENEMREIVGHVEFLTAEVINTFSIN